MMKNRIAPNPGSTGWRCTLAVASPLLLFVAGPALAEEEAAHLEQDELVEMIRQGRVAEAFALAFEHGDEMFETTFVAPDGVGANIGNGALFTRVPRTDLTAPGAWATHTPARITGPNAAACNGCHNKPFNDGAGGIAVNVVRDPLMTGNVAHYIERNTPHLFGSGAVQRLAEEMTAELRGTRAYAGAMACATGKPHTMPLKAKGVDFGSIEALPTDAVPCVPSFDTSAVDGVAEDLLVRPFRWKGEDATIRIFVRDAANNELGLQAVELVGHGVDGDHDDVIDELSVGDISAMEIYVAAQPRPVTRIELADAGVIDPLEEEEIAAIEGGEVLFKQVGCAQCHIPNLTVEDPTFSTPSQSPLYRDAVFPAGLQPNAEGVTPVHPISYDMTRDLPDNIVEMPDGGTVHLGVFERDVKGRAVVPLFADLKRHDMGPGLADAIDETGSGPSVWLTRPLWGLGSTDPYLHDGRATTIDEAIRMHGGEAAAVRDAYAGLSEEQSDQIIAYLENLVLYRTPEEEEEHE